MRVVPLLVGVSASLCLVTAAVAQPAPVPMPLPPPPPPAPEKSVTTGLTLGVIGSLVGPAMVIGGKSLDEDSSLAPPLYIGGMVAAFALPSAGVFYSEPSMAGMRRSPLYGIGPGVRALAIGAFIVDEVDDTVDFLPYAIGLYTVGCVIDLALTPHAVNDANARRAPQARGLSVAPTVLPHGGGIVAAGSF